MSFGAPKECSAGPSAGRPAGSGLGAQFYEPELTAIIGRAMRKLSSELASDAPFIADHVSQWLGQKSAASCPTGYFTHLQAVPVILLPWLMEKKINPAPDLDFQFSVICSTISGYYFIRLMDDVMDGDEGTKSTLLPGSALFYMNFETPYGRYFPPGSEFWKFVRRTWLSWAEVTIRDAAFDSLDRQDFLQVAGCKCCPGKIPMAAVCMRYGRDSLLPDWCEFYDSFSRWHQFRNDLFDWYRDLKSRNATYFLSEARRRKREGESVTGWFLREGFRWGMAELEQGLVELKRLAARLASRQLEEYVAAREADLLAQRDEPLAGFEQLTGIFRQSRPAPAEPGAAAP